MASKVSSIQIYSFRSIYVPISLQMSIPIDFLNYSATVLHVHFAHDAMMIQIIHDWNRLICDTQMWNVNTPYDVNNKYMCFILWLQVKSGKTEKIPAVAGKAKDAKKSAPVAAKVAVVAEPVKIDEVKAVNATVAAKPAPKKRGVVAKAAAATGKGRINKKQLLRGKGLKKKKIQLRYTIDCTNIAEDSIMDVADFVSSAKFNGKQDTKL